MRIVHFGITEKEVEELRLLLKACHYFEPQDHYPEYWEVLEKFEELFAQDIFDANCI